MTSELSESGDLITELRAEKDKLSRLVDSLEASEKALELLVSQQASKIREQDADIERILKNVEDLMSQLQMCKDSCRMMTNFYSRWRLVAMGWPRLVALGNAISETQLKPMFTSQDFGAADWHGIVPDSGQHLGRYIPGVGEQYFKPGVHWEDFVGDEWGLEAFARESFFQWREIGVSFPAKPLFKNLENVFKRSFSQQLMSIERALELKQG